MVERAPIHKDQMNPLDNTEDLTPEELLSLVYDLSYEKQCPECFGRGWVVLGGHTCTCGCCRGSGVISQF